MRELHDTEITRWLNKEMLFPLDPDDSLMVRETDSMAIVPLVRAEHHPAPDPPPGAARWERTTLHHLADLIPGDAGILLWIAPGDELIAVGEIRRLNALLPEAAAAYHRGEASTEDVRTRFRQAILYAQAPETPGFIACSAGGTKTIPVFSSLALLASFAGDTTWMSTTGADILDLLPEGYDLDIDPATPFALRLTPSGQLIAL